MPNGPTDSNDARQLIVEFATALHTSGLAAHELEASMSEIAEVLGERASYFATPTSIFITFGEPSEQRTLLLRVTPGEVNLKRLTELYSLYGELIAGDLQTDAALTRLRAVLQAPSDFGRLATVLAFGGSTASAAVFFGGGWNEVIVAGLIGLLIGALAVLSGHRPRLQTLFLPLASMLASTIAFGIATWLPVTSSVVTVSSLIILIPGLTLTIAMNELAMQNLASGTARLTGGFASLLIIGFGVAMGRSLVTLFVDPVVHPSSGTFGSMEMIVALSVAAASFMVLFQATWRDYVWILLAGFVAVFCSMFAVEKLGALAGPSIAAALLGCLSNGVSHWRKKPAAVTLVPGLLLLVPGSLGFRSVAELLDERLLDSFQSLFTMVLVSAAIVSGLLFANLLTSPQSWRKET